VATADFCSSIRKRSSKSAQAPLKRRVWLHRARCGPPAPIRIPCACACSCLTGLPPHPRRIAHSRMLRWRPTKCQTHEPAGLDSATERLHGFTCTRRPASRWRSRSAQLATGVRHDALPEAWSWLAASRRIAWKVLTAVLATAALELSSRSQDEHLVRGLGLLLDDHGAPQRHDQGDDAVDALG
jgi:hypothetical protein